MNKTILITASILGLMAVVLGAFAAHGFKDLIPSDSLDAFQTGVRYQMYHAIILLFLGSTQYLSQKGKKTIYCFIVFGVLLFSGSIYALSTNTLSSFDFKSIGFITPIGGFLLILAWLVLLIGFVNLKLDK